MLAALSCACIHAEEKGVIFIPAGGHTIVVGSGSHKSPARIEMPRAIYDTETQSLSIEYLSQIDGASYYIKGRNDENLMSGTMSFTEDAPFVINLSSVCEDACTIEIVSDSYQVVGEIPCE